MLFRVYSCTNIILFKIGRISSKLITFTFNFNVLLHGLLNPGLHVMISKKKKSLLAAIPPLMSFYNGKMDVLRHSTNQLFQANTFNQSACRANIFDQSVEIIKRTFSFGVMKKKRH